MNIRALAFDTGGMVLDWHGGLVRALASVGARHAIDQDWHAMANDRRRRTMKNLVVLNSLHLSFFGLTVNLTVKTACLVI